MITLFKYLFVSLCTLFFLISSANAVEVRLAVHWLPQAQFAGYYMAIEKGFYDDENIEMKLFHGGPDLVPADRLSSGEAHCSSMFLAAAIERKTTGIKLVNVCQLIQRSALMILTKKSDKINSVLDLEGKKLATWSNDFQIQPWALFKKHDVTIQPVPFSGSMELFLKNAVPATLAMWYNGYHAVLSAGYHPSELNPIYFKDTEFDFPEDGIYCLKNTLESNPTLVKSTITATLKGWKYAFAHKEETLKVVEKYMRQSNIPFSNLHQLWMLDVMEKIMAPKNKNDVFGKLSKNSFHKVAETIQDTGFSNQVITYEDFVWSGQ